MRWLCFLLIGATGVAASDGAGLSPTELQRAEALDRKRCHRCHKPYDPRDYSVPEWDEWMGKMSRKARLKTKDEELLKRYFTRKRGP